MSEEGNKKRKAASWVHTASNLGVGFIGFLFLVSFAVTLGLNFRPLYYLDMRLLDIPGTSGYPASLVKQNYDILISYNNLTGAKELVFAGIPMSETGRIHFEEVRRVFAWFEWTLAVSAPLFFAGACLKWRKRDYGFLKAAALFCAGIPAALAVLIAIDWEAVFVAFHRLVFRNDYWLFDPETDPVITMLPDAFFMHCAVLILGLVALGGLCFWLLYRKGLRGPGRDVGADGGKEKGR